MMRVLLNAVRLQIIHGMDKSALHDGHEDVVVSSRYAKHAARCSRVHTGPESMVINRDIIVHIVPWFGRDQVTLLTSFHNL